MLTLYSTLASLENIELNTTFRRYSSIVCQGMNLGSRNSSSIVYATAFNSTTTKPRPALIHYFVEHAFQCSNVVYRHLFAFVSWLKEHPDKDHFITPLEVWWKDLVEYNLDNFVPVQLLVCHSVYCDVYFFSRSNIF